MRKLSVLVLALVMVLSMSLMVSAVDWTAGKGVVKMGMDFNGQLDNGTVTEDVDNGFYLSGEYLVPYQDNMTLGAGLTYQLARNVKDDTDDFNFTPIYALVKVDTDMGGKYAPYLLGQVGYNLFSLDVSGVDTKGGLYWGIGGGLQVTDSMNAEVLYSVNNGKADDIELSYSKISVGVSFGF